MKLTLIKMNVFVSCLVCLFFFNTLCAKEVITDASSAPELIEALQYGGYVIYMRHGATDHSQNDTDRDLLENCLEQRNLSEKGRVMMSQVGKRLAELNIPIGQVFTSPYCRCKDTAQLVFGKFEIEPNLKFSISKNKFESAHLGDMLYDMIISTNNKDKNEVFVGHTSNLRDGLGIWPKPEGVMVVLKKQDNHLIYKGMIQPEVWLKQ